MTPEPKTVISTAVTSNHVGRAERARAQDKFGKPPVVYRCFEIPRRTQKLMCCPMYQSLGLMSTLFMSGQWFAAVIA